MVVRIRTPLLVSLAGISLIVILAGGCATVAKPSPAGNISEAELSIRRAEESNAPGLAPLELNQAREKLAKSKELLAKGDEKDWQEASRLAEQASVDARLAEAKARNASVQEIEREVRRSVELLRNEARM